jgi:hypothetical protein
MLNLPMTGARPSIEAEKQGVALAPRQARPVWFGPAR